MENEMIERVAKRIGSVNCARSWSPKDGPAPFMSDDERELHRAFARAAIEAMRHRTEPMLDAGTAALWPPGSVVALPGETSVKVWQSMVDAALGVGPAA